MSRRPESPVQHSLTVVSWGHRAQGWLSAQNSAHVRDESISLGLWPCWAYGGRAWNSGTPLVEREARCPCGFHHRPGLHSHPAPPAPPLLDLSARLLCFMVASGGP